VRRVFFCCVVGVRVLSADIVGEAAGVGVVVDNGGSVDVVVGNAGDVGVVVDNAGNTIATTTETIPTPIAQPARCRVCSCRASLCLRAISLRSKINRSDAVTLSCAGSVESDCVSKK
jgi:hypothetical protein